MSRAEGTWGEALAAEYLQKHGYKLAAHGYQCRFGEIDLIAWDGDILCFVEVKTRTNLQMGLPREYVTPAKQRRIKRRCSIWRRTIWIAPPDSTWPRSTRKSRGIRTACASSIWRMRFSEGEKPAFL